MRTAQRIGQIERVWRVGLGWAGLNYRAGCDTGDSRQSQAHGDGDCWCPGAGNLAIVEVFRLRTKKSGGRVELGSRDWTLC